LSGLTLRPAGWVFLQGIKAGREEKKKHEKKPVNRKKKERGNEMK
jgi:hypothetical protein